MTIDSKGAKKSNYSQIADKKYTNYDKRLCLSI